MIFSIAMVADYSFDLKNIDMWAHAFSKHNDSFIAAVNVGILTGMIFYFLLVFDQLR